MRPRPYSRGSQHLVSHRRWGFKTPREDGDMEAADAGWAGPVKTCTSRGNLLCRYKQPGSRCRTCVLRPGLQQAFGFRKQTVGTRATG